MKLSTSILSSVLAATAVANAPPSIEDLPMPSTHDMLKDAGFYDGRMDHQLRQLKAAVRRADLHKRDDGITVQNELDMVFAENENEYGPYGGKPVFRTNVNGPTKHPVLMLERFDKHIEGVQCTGDTVSVKFNNVPSFEEAKKTSKGMKESSLITSHPGCQEEDERRPFKIVSVSSNEDAMSVDYKVTKQHWKNVFKEMDMEYGFSDESHVLRKNAHREAKRAYSPTWTYPAMSLSAGVPSGTPTSDHGSTDLSWESKDSFTLPNIVTDHLAGALEVGCNDCKQTGTATFSQGKFKIDFDIDVSLDGIDFNMIKDGWVQLDITDYSLHMDMFLLPSASAFFFTPIVEIPFPGAGFKIPGFGKAGVFFSPALMGVATISSPIKFDWGFDVTLPDSSIKLDFSNFDGSAVNGFDQMEVNALPFTANDTQPSLALSGTFMPRIPIGIDFGVGEDDSGELPESGGLHAEAGLFVSTPKIQYTFTPGGCGGASGGNGTNGTSSDLALRDEGTMIKVEPAIGLDGGFDLSLGMRIAGLNPGIFTRVTLVSTSWTLSTMCYSVNLAEGTWSSVTAAPTDANVIARSPIGAGQEEPPKPLITPKPRYLPRD